MNPSPHSTKQSRRISQHTVALMYAWLMLVFVHMPYARAADDAATELQRLPQAGMLLTEADGHSIVAHRHTEPFIPASTTKLVTAWLALQHWGEDHRFATPVYLDRKSATLWIKGTGDPFIVSEELALLAARIAELAPGDIETIALDADLFAADLVVPGATTTANPYDAIPSALAANFNTLNLKREAGKLKSAEPQTPLTPFSRSFEKDIGKGTLRINTGKSSRDAEKYFAQLLREMLLAEDVNVGDKIVWGNAPNRRADIIYHNSRTLGEIIQLMLQYSTNFIANQLVLMLAAEESSGPANFAQVQTYLQRVLPSHFGWKTVTLLEGAGLSNKNRMTPQQLVELLVALKPWQHLLPEVAPQIYAKTGTLSNVSTLAGVIKLADDKTRLFAVMVNEAVAADFTRRVAQSLVDVQVE